MRKKLGITAVFNKMKYVISIKFVLLLMIPISGCTSLDINSTSLVRDKELVILAHGLGRSDWAMWRLEQRLEKANYNVCTLNYDTIGKSINSILNETNKHIDICLQNSEKTHFVGHSLGGLVIRSYLQNNREILSKEKLGEVVLMGTPNKGSELADHLSDSWLMTIGGEISRALMTGDYSLGNNFDELDINIGIIVATKSSSSTCEYFVEPNDGLVSVESAKLQSMSDFIAVEVTHTQMLYDAEVAGQTIHFLKYGEFKH